MPYTISDSLRDGKKIAVVNVQSSWEELYFTKENPSFPQDYTQIDVHFNDSIRFSSVGIVDWIRFCKAFGEVPFSFYECSHSVISYANLFPSFFPKKSRVESFYLPFYDPVTDESINCLLSRGSHFDDNGFIKVPEIKSSTGNIMEMDVSPDKYFNILKKTS